MSLNISESIPNTACLTAQTAPTNVVLLTTTLNASLQNGVVKWWLSSDAIINTESLVKKLRDEVSSLTAYLVSRFSESGRAQLAQSFDSATDWETLKRVLVFELNQVIGGESIYDQARFVNIELRKSTQKLIKMKPQRVALVRMNRLLIEDAFPLDISRPRGRGTNQIQKPATVHHFKKNGVWGVLANLVAPRVLEGKMRSGRQKFERQTQDLANDLCLEINNKLFGKELARQLTKREIDIAKKLFWELLEPKHPDWIDHTDKMVDHCEKTCFRVVHADIPSIIEAAKIFWSSHMVKLEPETRSNYHYMIAFLLPKFGTLKPFEMTDEMVLKMAEGTEQLEYWRTSRKWNQTAEETKARLWDTPTKSKSKRPWTSGMKLKFVSHARAFKNWMHSSKDPVSKKKRNWCPPSEMEIDDFQNIMPAKAGKNQDADEILDAQCKKKPALAIPQCQALLDVAFTAFDGHYAAFYVHSLFGGSRVKETKRMGAQGFDAEDGVQSISAEAAKKDEARESTLYDNLIIMVEALKSVGLYTDANLRPTCHQRTVIHMLAGFSGNGKVAIKRAKRERKRLEDLGVVLPPYNWKTFVPSNALRRTSLSMHYKLFNSVSKTVEWAGNSKTVFKSFYKRLVSKADAKQFWVMLPSLLKAGGKVTVNLPANHQLDSAMTKEVVTAIPVACQAMGLATEKIAQAKAKITAAKSAASKARMNKNGSEKPKAEELAAEQDKESNGADVGALRNAG
ncbi:MAG: hypothetical protein ABSA83_24360 [Verrucomicrobiota bacterium]|jgi:hypothetical protein